MNKTACRCCTKAHDYSGQGDRQVKMYMLQDANYNVMVLVDATGGVLEQYQWDDAWNRLIQVNLKGTLVYDPANPDTDDFNAAGQILAASSTKLGSLVAWYAYDALGRLIKDGEQTTDGLKTVHYYYDGVRRIQEVVDPSSPTGTGTTRGEYVYGPDYLDEFVLQSYSLGSGEGDRQAKMYMLQDANYNVMALVNATGGVLEQYHWDPYGTLVSKQTNGSPAPINRVGHQGLFFHSFTTADCLPLNADGLYYNRNRWYSPKLGSLTWAINVVQPVCFRRADASFNQTGHGGWPVAAAIDGNLQTGWGIDPYEGREHEAVFELQQPLASSGGVRLRFQIDQFERGHNLGRFRLSVTSTRPPIPVSKLGTRDVCQGQVPPTRNGGVLAVRVELQKGPGPYWMHHRPGLLEATGSLNGQPAAFLPVVGDGNYPAPWQTWRVAVRPAEDPQPFVLQVTSQLPREVERRFSAHFVPGP